MTCQVDLIASVVWQENKRMVATLKRNKYDKVKIEVQRSKSEVRSLEFDCWDDLIFSKIMDSEMIKIITLTTSWSRR